MNSDSNSLCALLSLDVVCESFWAFLVNVDSDSLGMNSDWNSRCALLSNDVVCESFWAFLKLNVTSILTLVCYWVVFESFLAFLGMNSDWNSRCALLSNDVVCESWW